MLRQAIWFGAGLLAFASAAAAQGVFEELPLRVAALRPGGACVIDRGQRDLVQVGDRVVLEPRNGPSLPGTITELDDRTALVQLLDPAAVVATGTKGHVLLPTVRRAAKPTAPAPDAGAPAPAAPAPPSDPDEWVPGMPLLGSTRPPRPHERPSSLHGRLYGQASLVRTLDSWSHSFLTTGVDVDIENLRGDGGTLHFHGEFDRSTETSANAGSDVRLYDFSYERGGTRFQPVHWQLGRFLPREMPEFGLLDGAAVGVRREGGDRLGASLGYLPELDEDLESLADLQVAAWYVWNQDVAERVSVGLGYQKSWHRFEPDRDLVVVKARYLPLEGWDLSTSLWIDFYTGTDTLKSETVELSRGNVFVSRRWPLRFGIELFVDHEAYPELRRRELPQTIQPQTLLEAHYERASVHAFVFGAPSTRWFMRATGWIDEEREGGALELGVAQKDLLQAGAQTTLAIFDVQGLTSTVLGLRIEHGGTFSFGRLDMLYELGFVHHEGFPDNRDDLLQHRFGGLLTTDLGAGFDATFYTDVTVWDEERSFGLGIYLQRLF